MSNGKLLTRTQIEHKFEAQIPWYEYQLVYSMFTSYFMKFYQKEDPSLFESLVVKDSFLNKGIISLLYKSLCGSTWVAVPRFQWAWAQDCQSCVHPETWTSIRASSLASAKSQVVRLQHLKVVTRWCITLVISSYCLKGGSTACWKGCGGVGSFFHCWWECPKIQVFWRLICHQISKIMSLQFPCTPELILLDLWNGIQITGYSRELISLLLLAANCLWVKLWKSTKNSHS